MGEFLKRQGAQDQAFSYYERAEAQGVTQATYEIAQCYELGAGCRQDPKKAMSIYEHEALFRDCTKSMIRLGAFYQLGIATDKDEARAFYYFSKAAEEGNYLAKALVADCYMFGIGVARDSKKAFELYEALVRQEDKRTHTEIYIAYTSDKKPLTALTSSAVEQLALYYHAGLGVEQNQTEALKYYQIAADAGTPIAHCRMGYIYEAQGAPERAFQQYKKAEDSDLIIASYLVARCYEKGIGVQPSIKEAVARYDFLANNTSFGMAQYALARCYERGIGVSVDTYQAYIWYERAAANEYFPALIRRIKHGGSSYTLEKDCKAVLYVRDYYSKMSRDEQERYYQATDPIQTQELGCSIFEAYDLAENALKNKKRNSY